MSRCWQIGDRLGGLEQVCLKKARMGAHSAISIFFSVLSELTAAAKGARSGSSCDGGESAACSCMSLPEAAGCISFFHGPSFRGVASWNAGCSVCAPLPTVLHETAALGVLAERRRVCVLALHAHVTMTGRCSAAGDALSVSFRAPRRLCFMELSVAGHFFPCERHNSRFKSQSGSGRKKKASRGAPSFCPSWG